MAVTLVTKDATKHPLTDQDYRDIFDELHDKGISLDAFIEMSGSIYSKAQWSKYARGLIPLNRAMKGDLLRAVNEKPLPLTVGEAVATADPDAAVWQVGEGAAAHVIMVGVTPVTLHVNSGVQIVALDPTSNTTLGANTAPSRTRMRYVRPCVPIEYSERLAGLVGVSWLDVVDAGLNAIEWKMQYGTAGELGNE